MKAHELIADPKHWSSEHIAQKADGSPTQPGNPEAVRRCALGAMCVAYPDEEEYNNTYNRLMEHVQKKGQYFVSDWNDMSTHEEVYTTLKALDI